MESFIAQQKTLIETIFQQIPQYIFWKNTHSVYLGCNQRYAELIVSVRLTDVLPQSSRCAIF